MSSVSPEQEGRPTFEEVYASHRVAGVRLATLLTGSQAAAEEILQDVFLRMHPRWDQIEDPRAYLRRAVVNASRSYTRRLVLHRTRDALLPRPLEVLPPAHDDELQAALRALPHRQRAVLVLRYYEDMPDEQIAALLGCRRATVRSIASRALLSLREVINP
jgi:RNA polymerase sigma-70 factor (sigma-E family)